MKAFRVHSRDHVRAVLSAAGETSRSVLLVSPPAALSGIGWWRELVRMARAEWPGISWRAALDCGPSAGLALAAIRAGIEMVWLDVDTTTLAKVADIAEQAGIRAERGGKDALDLLGEPDPGTRCREALRAGG